MDEILVHQDYSASGSKENDIALLRLGQSFVHSFFFYRFLTRGSCGRLECMTAKA